MFLKNIFKLIILIIPVLFITSCSETPTNVGSGLLGQDQITIRNLDSAADTLNVTSSYFKRTISLGTSSRIMLGKKGNIEAGILVKFAFSFADTLASRILSDSEFVDNAWIELLQNYSYGTETDPLELNAYKINSGWTTVGFNGDSLSSLQYENTEQSTGYTITDSLTRINLQTQLVLSWLKAAADTAIPADNGLYIKPGLNSARITGYYALGSLENLVPALYVVFRHINGVIDTLNYKALADLGYITGELPAVDTTNIVVQAGLEVLSRINFDLTSIPDNAIINKADIVLTLDTSQTVLGDNYINTLNAYFVVDTVSIDSLSSAIVLYPENNTYKGDVTFFVQEWVRNKNNSGLIISAGGRQHGAELFAIKGANSDAAVRPRIIITYTVKQ